MESFKTGEDQQLRFFSFDQFGFHRIYFKD
jgi:hypothetical protein